MIKLEKPCRICKQIGLQRNPCVICGWSRKKNDYRNKPTPLEQAKLDGEEARLEFLAELDTGMRKFNMQTVASEPQIERVAANENRPVEEVKEAVQAINTAVKREIARCPKCGNYYPADQRHKCKGKKARIA